MNHLTVPKTPRRDRGPGLWLALLLSLLFYAAVALLCGALSSCAGYPVAIRVEGRHGTYGYSPEGVTIDIRPGK